MKKRVLKKSDILREGYVNGLKEAQRIINEQLKFNVNEEQQGLNRESEDKILGYRVNGAKEELDKLVAAYQDGNYFRSDVGRTWFSLKQSIEDIRQILNKKFGRGSLRK